MLSLEKGEVREIIYEDNEIQILEVRLNSIEKAINYKKSIGKCKTGDWVFLNTIAGRLGLGTGGYHFVYLNLGSTYGAEEGGRDMGHIIKMKYTQSQMRFRTIEEFSDYKELFNSPQDLGGKPLVVTTLHSMVPVIAGTIKYLDFKRKVVCIYTYGGALNSDFSKSLRELKSKRIISSVITCGECFGGDFEAVNIYTALIFAYMELKCDVAVVVCGPGVAGTGTYYGFSTMEMIMPLYAGENLNLKAILSPRISFADKRERHYGISMQTMAILKAVDFKVSLPIYRSDKVDILLRQIEKESLNEKVRVEIVNSSYASETIEHFGIDTSVMGRKYFDDMDYFDNLSAVGVYAGISHFEEK